jgi:hypothetical protein
VDVRKQEVTVSGDKDGHEKTSHVDLPADISNGLMLVLLKNVPRDAVTTVAMLGGDKPRLVRLVIQPVGTETFQVAGVGKKATHFVLKTEIGGITGVLAHVMGKVPSDLHVWIATEDPPTFVKFEGPLYVGGPVWRIELAAPGWGK